MTIKPLMTGGSVGDKHPGGDGDRTNFHRRILHGDQHQRHQIERDEHDRVHDHRQAKQNRLVDVKHRGTRTEARHFAHVLLRAKISIAITSDSVAPRRPSRSCQKLFGNDMRRRCAGLNRGDVVGLVFHPQRTNNAVNHRAGVNAH